MAQKKIFAAAAILVRGKHHDIGDPVVTDDDDAAALVRMGRAVEEGSEGHKEALAIKAAVEKATKPAAK